MRILFYISTLSGGGAARVMVNLANEFDNAGDEVILVTNLNEKSAYNLNPGIKMTVIDSDGILENKVRRNLSRIIKLRTVIKNNKPDIAISFMNENNIRCILATLGLQTKVFTSVRSDPRKECGIGLRGFCNKLMYLLVTGVVCQTEDAKCWFFKQTQNRSTVIFNQVGNEYYTREITTNKKSGIVSAGRFVDAKNHILLIKAYAMIANEVTDNLIIYGDGPLKNRYLELVEELEIKERVEFPGVQKDMIPAYDKAKVFVMSSDYEGLPNSLMEAMVRNVPCISTDCPIGGPRALFDGDNNGILVPVGNQSALANAMLDLATNEKLRQQYIEKSKMVVSEFKSERVLKTCRDFVEKQIKK